MVEVLVVIVILALIFALLVPAVQKMREASDRIVCLNRLKQIGLAVHCYHDAHGNRLPNGSSCHVDEQDSPGTGSATESSTIFYLLLPYLDQFSLYRQGNCTDAAVRATIVEAYLCPLNVGMTNQYGKLTHHDEYGTVGYLLNRQGNAHGSYAANAMIFPLGNIAPGSITQTFRDGTSNTVILAERYHVCFTPEDGTHRGVGWSMPGWADTSTSSWDWPLFGTDESTHPYIPGFSNGALAFQAAPG